MPDYVFSLGLIPKEWIESECEPDPLQGEELERFLAGAQRIKGLFGSLSSERPRDSSVKPFGPLTPRPVLRSWLEKGLPKDLAPVYRDLSGYHTSGHLAFYDAVPAPDPDQDRLLELDLLNLQYPKFLDHGKHPPSDDQNPKPIFFLAVKSGVRFIFPFRLQLRSGQGRDKAGQARRELLGNEGREELAKLVRCWMEKALTEWGVGAKTASGYGYFTRREPDADKRRPKRREKNRDARIQSGPGQDSSPPAEGEDDIRENQSVKVEVIGKEGDVFILRVKQTGQEGLRFNGRFVPWEIGETRKVRVTRLFPDGRIREIRP